MSTGAVKYGSYTWKQVSDLVTKYIANVGEEWEEAPRTRTLPMLKTVYCLLEKAKNKLWYIGQSQWLGKRILQHKNNPKISKHPWDTVIWLEPAIPSVHVRLQVETVLTTVVVPPLNNWISIRRLANNQWKEIKQFPNSVRYATCPRIRIGRKT